MQSIPLGKYEHIKSVYIPLADGFGCTCDNCGRLIANMVTVQHESGKYYTIGQDCAKTIMSKDDNAIIDETMKYQTRLYKKLAELNKAGKPYTLNDKGWPCYPPETRHGYFIPY